MTDEEKRLADAYAKINGCSLSKAIKKAFFERIEEEYHQDRKHSEVIDMIHRAIEDYTSTLEFPGY